MMNFYPYLYAWRHSMSSETFSLLLRVSIIHCAQTRSKVMWRVVFFILPCIRSLPCFFAVENSKWINVINIATLSVTSFYRPQYIRYMSILKLIIRVLRLFQCNQRRYFVQLSHDHWKDFAESFVVYIHRYLRTDLTLLRGTNLHKPGNAMHRNFINKCLNDNVNILF